MAEFEHVIDERPVVRGIWNDSQKFIEHALGNSWFRLRIEPIRELNMGRQRRERPPIKVESECAEQTKNHGEKSEHEKDRAIGGLPEIRVRITHAGGASIRGAGQREADEERSAKG
jgi:hypothetical protein